MRLLSTLVSAMILGSIHSLAAAVDESVVDIAAREAEASGIQPPLDTREPEAEPEILGEHELVARGPNSPPLPNGWKVVSQCSEDAKSRVFPQNQGTLLSTLRTVLLDNTPAKCAARCAQDKYPYAAVRMGVECWCSRQQPKIVNKNKNQCNYKCPGNNNLTCGSFGTSQVYVNWGLSGKKAPKVNTPRLANGWSVAFDCVVDPTVGENFLKNTDVFELANNSPFACTKLCREKGYQLAGVEYSNECMCGKDWKTSGPRTKLPQRVNRKKCYLACTGDKTLTCGAGHHVQMYKHKSFKSFNNREIEFDYPF